MLRRLGWLVVAAAIMSRNVCAQEFALQSADGDFRLRFGFLAQIDGRFATDDPQAAHHDTFTIRRLRPMLQGRIARLFDFYFNPDLAGGVVTVLDAYVDMRVSPALRVRVGKAKQPFGLERLQTAPHTTFIERAFPSSIGPNRDVGVQALGDAFGGVVAYQAGIFNGVVDGGSADTDTNDGKDLAGRLAVRPFAAAEGSARAGFGVALAASTGSQPSTLPSFASSSRQTFFRYDAAAAGVGPRTRVSPQVFYVYKSLASFGEYVRSAGTVRIGPREERVTHDAVSLTGSVVVTGERASERGVTPAHPFDPGQHTWGALQIAARYHALWIDPRAVAFGAAAEGSSLRADAVGIGANWYLNPSVRWTVDLERTVFGDALRDAQTAILVRSQLAF